VDAVLLDVGLTDGPSFALAWYLADAGYRSPLQQHVDRMNFDSLLNVTRELCTPAGNAIKGEDVCATI